MVCSKCGKEIGEEMAFCPSCGNAVEEVKKAAAASESEIKNQGENRISKRSRVCAFILGFFLGEFGIHNFYLGRILRGVCQCVLFIAGFIFYLYSLLKLTMLETSQLPRNEEFYEDISFHSFMILLGIVLLLAAVIWSFVEWVKILNGTAKDAEGLKVIKWTNE
ncbi:MAG: NINE protein [Treponema sp.]|nr:NINE protein [Treponema sp.]